jgi:hypothetical protein
MAGVLCCSIDKASFQPFHSQAPPQNYLLEIPRFAAVLMQLQGKPTVLSQMTTGIELTVLSQMTTGIDQQKPVFSSED